MGAHIFIAKSAFHGPGRNGLLEIKPINDIPNAFPNQKWYAIHGPNASSELSMIENLNQLNEQKLPILPLLLGEIGGGNVFKLKSMSSVEMSEIAREIIQEFKFNVDQIK